MANAGRILIIPKGDYNANSTYEKLDLVKYKGTSWLAKKTVTGIEPSEANVEYWQNMLDVLIANNLTTTEEGYALDATQGKVLNEKITGISNDLSYETIISGEYTVYKYANGKMIIEWTRTLDEVINIENTIEGIFYAIINPATDFPIEFVATPVVTSLEIVHSDQHSPFIRATADSINRLRFDRCIIWATIFTAMAVGDMVFARFEGRWK